MESGLTTSANLFPEGPVNPSAFYLKNFNDILAIGTFPCFAYGPFLIVNDKDGLFQYTFAKPHKEGKKSFLQSDIYSLEDYKSLIEEYTQFILTDRGDLDANKISEIETWLDKVFSVNERTLKEASIYHLRSKGIQPQFDYSPPELTAYGRLVHNEANQPMVEHNLILFHYLKSVKEFKFALDEKERENLDESISHGAYSIIALAAVIESAANRVYYFSRASTVAEKEKTKAEDRLLTEAEAITKKRLDKSLRKFDRLKQTSTEYNAFVEVRKIRNHFLHVAERSFPIAPGSNLSEIFNMVTPENCHRLLKDVTSGLLFVFNQLPEISMPADFSRSLKWLEEVGK